MDAANGVYDAAATATQTTLDSSLTLAGSQYQSVQTAGTNVGQSLADAAQTQYDQSVAAARTTYNSDMAAAATTRQGIETGTQLVP